jgi:retinol dehydrogenase-12
MVRILSRTAEQGSRQLIWAAVGLPESGSLDELRGSYISRASIEEPSDFVLGVEGKKREDKLFVSSKSNTWYLSIIHRIWFQQDDMVSIIQKVDPRVEEIASQYLA